MNLRRPWPSGRHRTGLRQPSRASRGTSRASLWRLGGAFALGAGFGATASLSNAGASQLAVVVSILLGAGWAWAGLAVAAGWLAGRTGTRAALAAVLALLAATTAYYALDSVLRDEPFGLYQQELHRWWLASAVCGPLLGVVGAYVERPGARGLLAALTVPAGALVQMVVHPPGAGNLIVTPETRLAQAIVLAASGAGRRRRARALPRRAASLKARLRRARCRSRNGSSPSGLHG